MTYKEQSEIRYQAILKLEAKIQQLEKENAELKEEIKNNEDLATVAYMQGADNQKRKSEKQLSEAKNHIHRLLVLLIDGKRSYAVIDEARAFMRKVSE